MNFAASSIDAENSIDSICSTRMNSSFINPALVNPAKGLSKADKILLGKTKPSKPKDPFMDKPSPAKRVVKEVIVPRTRFQASVDDAPHYDKAADLVAEDSFLSTELLLTEDDSLNTSVSVSPTKTKLRNKAGRGSSPSRRPVIKMDNETSKVIVEAPAKKPIPFVVTEVTDTSTKPRKVRLPPVKFKHVITDKNNPLALKQKSLFQNPNLRKVVRNHTYNNRNANSQAINAILSPRYERHAFAAANTDSGDPEVDDFAVMFSSSTVLTPPAPTRPTQFGYREKVFAEKYTPPAHCLFTPAGLLFPDDHKDKDSKPTTSKTAYVFAAQGEDSEAVGADGEGDHQLEQEDSHNAGDSDAPFPDSQPPAASQGPPRRSSPAIQAAERQVGMGLTIGENAFDNESESGLGPWRGRQRGDDREGELNLGSKSFLDGGEDGELSMISQSGLVGADEEASLGRHRDFTAPHMEPTPAMEYRPPPSLPQDPSALKMVGTSQKYYKQMNQNQEQEQQEAETQRHRQRQPQQPQAQPQAPQVELDPRLVREAEKQRELDALRGKPERRIKKGTTGKGVYHWESAKPTKDHKRPVLRKRLVCSEPQQLTLDAAIGRIAYAAGSSSPTHRPPPLMQTSPDPILVRNPEYPSPEGFVFAQEPSAADAALAVGELTGSRVSSAAFSRPPSTVRGGSAAVKVPITGVEIRRTPGASFFAQMSSRSGLRPGGSIDSFDSVGDPSELDGESVTAMYRHMCRDDGFGSGASTNFAYPRAQSRVPMGVINVNQSLAEASIADSVSELNGGVSVCSSHYATGSFLLDRSLGSSSVSAADSIDVTNPLPLVDQLQLPSHYHPITAVPLVATLSPNKSHRKVGPGPASVSAPVDCEALRNILAAKNSPRNDKKSPAAAKPKFNIHWSPEALMGSDGAEASCAPSDEAAMYVGSGSGVVLHDAGLPGSKLTTVRSPSGSPHKNGAGSTTGSPLKPHAPVVHSNGNAVSVQTLDGSGVDLIKVVRYKPPSPSQPLYPGPLGPISPIEVAGSTMRSSPTIVAPDFVPLSVKLSPTARAKKQLGSASPSSFQKAGGGGGTVVIPSIVAAQKGGDNSGASSKATSPHHATRPMTDADTPSPSKPTTCRPLTRPMTDATVLDEFRASPIPLEDMETVVGVL